MLTILVIFATVAVWVFGFLVGRKNPDLPQVNKLIAEGHLAIDKTGQLISAIKKVV